MIAKTKTVISLLRKGWTLRISGSSAWKVFSPHSTQPSESKIVLGSIAEEVIANDSCVVRIDDQKTRVGAEYALATTRKAPPKPPVKDGPSIGTAIETLSEALSHIGSSLSNETEPGRSRSIAAAIDRHSIATERIAESFEAIAVALERLADRD